MMVIVVVAGAAGAGGAAPAGAAACPACTWSASAVTTGDGAAPELEVFAVTWILAGTTAIGSPPNGSSATTAHSAKMAKNATSKPVTICGTGILIVRRRFLISRPSGAVRSSVAIGYSLGPAPRGSCPRESRWAVYHGGHRAPGRRQTRGRAPNGGLPKKVRGGFRPPRIPM